MGGLNLGDVLFQLFSLGFVVLIVVLIVGLIRSSKRRKSQLDRIEEKIDLLKSKHGQ